MCAARTSLEPHVNAPRAFPHQHFGSKRSISKVDLPSVFLPAELRARLFDVLQAQLSGFSMLGVCRLDQSSSPDAGFGSDAGCDVPAMEGDRYTWTGATDSGTGLSTGGSTGSVANPPKLSVSSVPELNQIKKHLT